jgi:hypothetical protein
MPDELRPTEQPPRPNGGCIAVAMIVLGGLILVLSGLCTAALGIGAVVGALNDPNSFFQELPYMIPYALMVIVVAVGGFLLIRAGLAMQRKG